MPLAIWSGLIHLQVAGVKHVAVSSVQKGGDDVLVSRWSGLRSDDQCHEER